MVSGYDKNPPEDTHRPKAELGWQFFLGMVVALAIIFLGSWLLT